MAEPSEESKYIKCSKCRCKNITDDEHVKQYFGYNTLEERFKACVKCRETRKKEISERMKEYRGQFDQEVYDHHQYCTRCYKIKHKITNIAQGAITLNLKLAMENTIIVH